MPQPEYSVGEILQWATATELEPPLRKRGLEGTAISNLIDGVSQKRQASILQAILQRQIELGVTGASPNPFMDELLDGDEPFAPFSLITSDMKTYDQNDPAYVALRDLVAQAAFPDCENQDPRERGYGKHISGRALSILKLADPQAAPYDWHAKKVKEAEALGFSIHPGKGVTFAQPRVIARAPHLPQFGRGGKGKVGQKPREALLRFAWQHTTHNQMD